MTVDNRREELLSYVQTWYQRTSDQSSRNGITYWAVLGAIVYLFWDLAEALSSLKEPAGTRFDLYYLFSAFHIALIGITAVMRWQSTNRQENILSYRLKNTEPDNPGRFILYLIFFAAPLYCLHRAWPAESQSGVLLWQMSGSYWFIVIVNVLHIISYINDHLEKKRGKLPSPLALVIVGGGVNKVIYISMHAICLEMFLGNMLLVLHELLWEDLDHHIIVAGFDLSLILFAMIFLIKTRDANRLRNRLAALERDIIIHNISTDEIVKRLNEEFLGSQIGEWLEERLEKVKRIRDGLVEHCGNVDYLISELSNIDPQYSREIDGRIDDYISTLTSRTTDYTEAAIPLVDWLKKATRNYRAKDNSYLADLVESKLNEIENEHEQLISKSELSKEKLLKGMEKLYRANDL